MTLAFSEASMKSKQMEDQRLAKWDAKTLTIGNKFLVGLRVTTGSFGEVRLGRSIQTGEDVIIKMEPLVTQVPTLLQEYRFYNMLGFVQGKLQVIVTTDVCSHVMHYRLFVDVCVYIIFQNCQNF